MSIIKCISHVLESILDGVLTVLGLTFFLNSEGSIALWSVLKISALKKSTDFAVTFCH